MVEFLQKGEDAWYGVLDRIETRIPIYRVIDPLDKIVPSFYVAIILVLALGLGIGMFLSPMNTTAGVTDVTLHFIDDQHLPLVGLPVALTQKGVTADHVTNESGKIILSQVKMGERIDVHVESTQYDSLDTFFWIKKNNGSVSFTLLSKSLPSQPLVFQLVTTGNQLLEGTPITANVTCPQHPGVNPLLFSITDGVFRFETPTSCDAWYGEFSGDGYETVKNVLLDTTHPIIALAPITYAAGTISATVLSAKTLQPLSGMDVQRYTKEGILIEQTFTSANGVALFSNIEYGEYYLAINDPQNEYAGTLSELLSIFTPVSQPHTFYVLPVAIGGVGVHVENEQTQTPIENAHVKIQRKIDGKILSTNQTNANGNTAVWNPSEKGTYSIIVTHENYLSETNDVTLNGPAATVSFSLQTITKQNAASIQVHTLDEKGKPLQGVHVILYDSATHAVVQEMNPLFTNANGEAVFQGISPGNYRVGAHLYPFTDVESDPILITGNETHTIELTLDTNPANVDALFDSSENEEGIITPCSQNCLPSLVVSLSQIKIPAFDAGAVTVSVQNTSEENIEGAIVSLYLVGTSGNKKLLSTNGTNVNGKATIHVPSSSPGTLFILRTAHPEYEPTETGLTVQNGAVDMSPSTLVYPIPFGPGIIQSQSVQVQNDASSALIISDVHIAGNIGKFLDYWEMLGSLTQKKDSFIVNAGESAPLAIDAITLPTIAAILNASENGTFILTFQSLSTKQKWVQSIPFSATLETLGECDSDTLIVSGLGENNQLEMDAFESVNTKVIQVANGCTVDGQPIPLQNLKAKVGWNTLPSGLIQLEITDPQTKKKTIETLRNGEYVTLLNNFNPSTAGAYPVNIVFVPQTNQPGSTAGFTITFAAESGLGEGKKTLSKTFPITIGLSNLETCVKITPEATEGIHIGSDATAQSFILDASGCNVPVNVSFCPEGTNAGCSGGALEGKIQLSPETISGLTGTQTVNVERIQTTLPGTYDVTVYANAGGDDHLIARMEVNVESDHSYAFSMKKTTFTLYGKGSQDSTDVINHLLNEQIAVTAGLCEWMAVATNTTGAFWGGFAASSIVSGTLTYAVGLGAITGQFAVLGLAVCPVCSLVGLIVGMIVQFLLTGTEDICMIMLTVDTMHDWVINLYGVTDAGEQLIPPDALDVTLVGPAKTFFSGKWALTEPFENIDNGENGTQIMGITYENTSGYANPNPLFAVTVLRATEHIHGDEKHAGEAEVFCEDGTFEDGKIGPDPEQGSCDAEDSVREEKFHIKLKTAEAPNLIPNFNAETFSCQTGNVLGQTGPGALPRVAFNWSWNETTGIPLYACDASNPNGIYCDAVQMNIDLMKRVRALEEFLEVNNYQFDCPDDPTATPESASATITPEVPTGEVGITHYGYSFITPTRLRLTMGVKNNTFSPQTIGFTANVHTTGDLLTSVTGADAPLHCETEGILSSGSSFGYQCDIEGIGPEQYGIVLHAENKTTGQPIGTQNFGIDAGKYHANPSPVCVDQPKTTASLGGKPGINQWVDAADKQFGKYVNDHDVKFTTQVPSIDALNKLLHYEANLIQDGYSVDFENDFASYYSQTSFADAPVWFKGASSTPAYASLYDASDTFIFRNKYFNSSTLPASGRYHVDVDVKVNGNDWRFFEPNGTTNVKIEVNVQHLNHPSPNSPFYRLPFDGHVGLIQNQFDRHGYGLNFITQNGTIHINDSPVVTYANAGGSTHATLLINHPTDFKTLNSIPETRGQVLQVTTPTGTAPNVLTFSPSRATPVMMRIIQSTQTPASVFYQLAEGGNPIVSGQNLTFWNGSPACMDFSGIPSHHVFNVTPDRSGTLSDKRTDWEVVYALDWPAVNLTGKEYVESIFYTPVQGDYALLAASSNVNFVTSNYGTYSSGQLLDGTLGLTYNNESSSIDSIQDVFDLVVNQSICVQNTGVNTRFVWNAPALYAQHGQTSIDAEWNAVETNQCIQSP